MRFLKTAWAGWKRFAFWLGDKQATLIYSVLYFILVGPIALARRPFTDPLQFRAHGNPTFWLPRPSREATLEEARQQ